MHTGHHENMKHLTKMQINHITTYPFGHPIRFQPIEYYHLEQMLSQMA